jgi:hypothetical protein
MTTKDAKTHEGGEGRLSGVRGRCCMRKPIEGTGGGSWMGSSQYAIGVWRSDLDTGVSY